MSFEWPHMLFLALGPLALIWSRLKRARGTPSLGLPHVKRGMVEGGHIRFGDYVANWHRRPWRFWSAVLLLILALARPQWGPAENSVSTSSLEVIVALDVSRSMLSTDVAPSRLEQARLLAAKAADDFPIHKFGLIGFAGSAHLLTPPADDRAMYHAFLRDLGPEHIIDQGSNFASLFEMAATAFSPDARERLLLVLSDGEAEEEAWQDRLANLRASEIRVLTVGVGTKKGSFVPGVGDRPILDESGRPVLSRLNPAALSEMGDRTGGAYLEMPEPSQMRPWMQSNRKPASGTTQGDTGAGHADRFVWFLLLALLLLGWSARAEWLARPKMRNVVRQPALTASLLVCLALLGMVSQPLTASVVDLHEEDDPLEAVKETVSELLKQPELNAQNYLAFAEAATRYGEVQRGLAQPLAEGVLEDALAAIDEGRRLDPAAADWAAMTAKVKRLLIPPPPVKNEDSEPPDAANERVDAKQEVPIADPSLDGQPDSSGKEEDAAGVADRQNLRTVGGSRRDAYDEAEWRNDALATPLYQLERLRGTGSPAELFRRTQSRSDSNGAERGQVW